MRPARAGANARHLTLDHNDAFSTGTGYGDRCAGSLGVDGNIAAAPLFSGPGDYTLPANSPAVDAGDNGAVEVGTLDFNGAPRIQNAKSLATAIIDLGAFERAGVPTALPAPDFSLSADASTIDLTTTHTATVTLTLAPRAAPPPPSQQAPPHKAVSNIAFHSPSKLKSKLPLSQNCLAFPHSSPTLSPR